MIEPPPRSLRLRLDREALAGNWRAVDRMSGRAAAGAAVKADAYGLGIANAVPELREGDWLDVPYHLPDAANRCGLSQYEVLTTLGRRFRRGA